MKRLYSAVISGLLILTIAACASMGGGSTAPVEVRQGRIEIGAILGGVGGAAIGSLVGGGSGRDVAIAIGALGGAVGGQYAQNKYETKQPGQQVIVRLNSGVLVVVTQATDARLTVG